MSRWYSLTLIMLLALLLAACGPFGSSPSRDGQRAPVLAVAQHPDPTARATVSAVPITIDSANAAPVPSDPPDTCPITQPPDPPFVPPPPYPSTPPPLYGDAFWYGTEALWTMPRVEGTWRGLPQNKGMYGQKTFWWRRGYDWRAEPEPKLTVTGKRLDAPAPPLEAGRATNGFRDDIGSFMLVGVGIPTLGCWEITGHIEGQALSFVVWVVP